MKFREYIWLVIIAVLVMLLGYEYVRKPIITTILRQDTILVRDTIKVVAKGKIKYKIMTKTIVRNDTTYIQDTLGFRSCIDTTVGKAAMNVCFEYPLNTFAIQVTFRPDTVRTVTVIEKPIFRYEKKESSIWWDIGKVGGGVIIGYILGRVK